LQPQTPNTKHQTPNTKHQTPNTKQLFLDGFGGASVDGIISVSNTATLRGSWNSKVTTSGPG
jgi:hypothetical protein